jgi:hypothetical protein
VVGPVVWLWLWGLLRCTLKVLDFQSGFTSGRVASQDQDGHMSILTLLDNQHVPNC